MNEDNDALKDEFEGTEPAGVAFAYDFEVSEGYDYARRGRLATLWHYIFFNFAQIVMYCLNKLLFGLKIEGKGNLNGLEGGAVVICNHVNTLDCTFIAAAMPFRRLYFTTLERNFGIPVARTLEVWLGGVPVPKKPRRLAEFADKMVEIVKTGDCVCVYPEGVLYPYYRRGVRRFSGGAFVIAARAECPVVPMVVTYRPRRGLYRLYKRRPCATISVLPPVYPPRSGDTRSDSAQLMQKCRELMNDAVLAAK